MYNNEDTRKISVEAAHMARGRPRAFDYRHALEAALEVFWTKGYEGTSIADLTEAMGVGKASLYSSFGRKEELFQLVLDLYVAEKISYTRDALHQPTARKVAMAFMRGALDAQVGEHDPKGCLGVISLNSFADDSQQIKALAVERTCRAQQALIRRFEGAKADGDLTADTDAAGLASYLYAILQGMAVQAASGATRAHLERLIQTSMAVWPSK